MSDYVVYPYVGAGIVYGRKWGTNDKFLDFGNVPALEIKVSEEKKALQNYRRGGGGNYATLNRIKAVEGEVQFSDLNVENLKLMWFGTSSSILAGSVTNQSVIGHRGALLKFEHLGVTNLVLTNSSGSITYVDGVDYVHVDGDYFVTQASAITDGQELLADYSHAGHSTMEALTTTAPVFELYFSGLNEANGGKEVKVDIWKAQFSPVDMLSLIGDEFAKPKSKFELLADTGKPAGVSQFFSTKMVV